MARKWWVAGLVGAGAAGLFVLEACSDEAAPAAVAADAGPDAVSTGEPDSAQPTTDDAGGSPSDAGDAGNTQSFTVPSGGGSVDVSGTNMKVTMTFPASAAGKTVTFEPSTATAIGWPADQFAEVIKMGPNGERFADPVLVKPSKPELVSAVLSFSDAPGKSPASPLPLKADGSGFELRHFSTLVVVSPGRLCDSEGYNDTPNDSYCAAGLNGHTTKRVTGCKGYSYCLNSSVTCCVVPGADGGGCTWSDPPILGTQTPTDSNGGQYPYCQGDAGDWDGGTSGCLNPKPSYAWTANGGCTTNRYECPPSYSGRFELACDGGSCTCNSYVNSTATAGPTFVQGAACDNTATMLKAFVQTCNYPAYQ